MIVAGAAAAAADDDDDHDEDEDFDVFIVTVMFACNVGRLGCILRAAP